MFYSFANLTLEFETLHFTARNTRIQFVNGIQNKIWTRIRNQLTNHPKIPKTEHEPADQPVEERPEVTPAPHSALVSEFLRASFVDFDFRAHPELFATRLNSSFLQHKHTTGSRKKCRPCRV